jgi:tetratricopeptide (TPR) repeat protein
MNKSTGYKLFLAAIFLSLSGVSNFAQSPIATVNEMHRQIVDYFKVRSRELASQGKRIDAEMRDQMAAEQKALAKKYAAEAEARTDLKIADFYYLGMIYDLSGNAPKSIETMKRFIAQYPPGAKGEAIQSARAVIVALSAKQKQFAEAEQTFQEWLKGEPFFPDQRPVLEQNMAVSFYKAGKYDEAVRYGQSAFNLLKTLEAKTLAGRRAKMELYGNLVEVLALSYRKAKQSDEALNVLAESRALSCETQT